MDKTTNINVSIPISFMNIGLYTVTFEVLSEVTRISTINYLIERSDRRLNRFKKNTQGAGSVFRFCGPILIHEQILKQEDFDFLNRARLRRNEMVHEGYKRASRIIYSHIEEDLYSMDCILSKILAWDKIPKQPTVRISDNTVRVPFELSPAIFTNYFSTLVREFEMKSIRDTCPPEM